MKNHFDLEKESFLQIAGGSHRSAVALKYPKGAEFPFVTAKGKAELAEKIIQIARENDIHIEENGPLVNLLSAQEINAAVPEEAYSALAAIFAFVLEKEGRSW